MDSPVCPCVRAESGPEATEALLAQVLVKLDRLQADVVQLHNYIRDCVPCWDEELLPVTDAPASSMPAH